MRKMKLSAKLLVTFLAVGVIPAAVIGLLAMRKTSTALEQQSYNQLIAMRDVKKVQIETYIQNLLLDMEVFARSQDFNNLYSKLVEYHIATDTKADGSYDVTTPEYKNIWDEYGANILQYYKDSGVYDVLMVCAAHGHVMYTCTKESDLAHVRQFVDNF